MADQDEDQYICVGICMADPDSGYCLGCGRPPLESPEVVCEVVAPVALANASDTSGADPDNPE